MWKRLEASRDRSIVTAATAMLALVAFTWTFSLAGCGSDVPTGDDTPDPEIPQLAAPPIDGGAAVATITAADLAARIGVLAHDSMMGRWTPSPELEKAAQYLAAEFARLGLVPGASADPARCVARGIAPGHCPYLQWFIATTKDTEPAVNVVARLPGSDPAVSAEHVVIGAHFDHIGIRVAIAGDSIYNGADDNGSGTAGVMELAEAYADLAVPPRRSVLFVFFSGEERGLLGSRHFVTTPEAPMGNVVSMINLDMIGRNWKDTVVAVYQPGSNIFERAGQVAEAHPELDMNLLTDQWPGENLVNRSDQAAFIPYGIPVLFLTSGTHDDYHQPSDEMDRIDYEKTARLVRLVFWIGWEFAEATVPPGFYQ